MSLSKASQGRACGVVVAGRARVPRLCHVKRGVWASGCENSTWVGRDSRTLPPRSAPWRFLWQEGREQLPFSTACSVMACREPVAQGVTRGSRAGCASWASRRAKRSAGRGQLGKRHSGSPPVSGTLPGSFSPCLLVPTLARPKPLHPCCGTLQTQLRVASHLPACRLTNFVRLEKTKILRSTDSQAHHPGSIAPVS